MSSDEDGAALMASFKKGASTKAPPPIRGRASFSTADFVSKQSSGDDGALKQRRTPIRRRAVAVRALPVRNREEYTYYELPEVVESILREFEKKGNLMYEVKLTNGITKEVDFDELLALEDGARVFQEFQHYDDGDASSASDDVKEDMKLRKNRAATKKDHSFLDFSGLSLSSDDELLSTSHKPRQHRRRLIGKRGYYSRSTTRSRRSDPMNISTSNSEESGVKRRRRRKVLQEPSRRSNRARVTTQAYEDEDDEEDDEDDDEDDEDDDSEDTSGIYILRSDIMKGGRKRKRGPGRPPKSLEKLPRSGTRQSERTTRTQKDMREADINDIYRSDSDATPSNTVKVAVVKEIFETLPRSNLFRSRHVEGCEVCSEGPNLAPLIYCQGCSLAYHKNCIGSRSTREHLVTKVAEGNFVLQCRRCINVYQKKDPTAPDLSQCQDCHRSGPACKPFRQRKTTIQEQKEREDNGGQDPIVDVPSHLINNAQNVLFRCTKCSRAYHYHHLPPLSPYSMDISRDENETADERFQEYSKKWLCKECDETGHEKVQTLIAWRPSDVETFHPGTSCQMLNEDDKQYLVKWEGQSYFRATWFPGAWVWGVTAGAMRKAFFKREDGPKMRTEDAIPEEYLRIDIVLDVKYTSYVEVRTEEIDKARIKEVDKALIKYKGLGYEDAVWEKVPTPEDGDRWLDFVTAYNDWVAGRYIRYPKQGALKARLEKARSSPFAKLEKQKQPESLVGGELMKYQMDGLNWLYYQWYSQKNGILADEMGLGKTIQVIGFMSTLIEDHNCFPFLVVVPNSTCANWRREIKQWVPSLRVVTYFGSATARDMASKYEMFPEGSKDLRCHVVVTSYEAAADESSRRILRRISWAGLIVDEGQRLKNDKSQLYGALTAVKAPFRLLMTGTPLQNNARELFNLLQFLDETINAAELEEKYSEMTAENVRELHDQIRPFILRRTKAQVLTFLPPLGQIIVPVSMSVLQKSLYKTILSKNPVLLKSLFTSGNLKANERANMRNILMQLRKTLCHPFVYNREIEERTDIKAVSHRNLVEASAKLQLLELLLPKLQERGHRVLIFSQFLDMLDIIEDFLDGMQMTYQRLDGTMGSLEKQKRIDQFNAPDSPLFAFLLSTRAGGVGINLATADTVIILDPDFNPHQDIQAISRAHRIGQKKKVLCFQLMTRASVEEKIVQMGRKKMALDHVVVEQLDAEDLEEEDVESILKFGAAQLFKDGDADTDIRYDDASIDKLLDRSQIENTKTNGDNSAESQFSFARVWANDEGALEDTLDTAEDITPPDPGVWEKILKERQAAAAREALARADALGRGKRARVTVDYATTEQEAAGDGTESASASPVKVEKRRKPKKGSGSDTDFMAEESEEEDSASEPDEAIEGDAMDLKDAPRQRSASTVLNKTPNKHNPSGASRVPSRHPSKFPPFTLSQQSSSSSQHKSAASALLPVNHDHPTIATFTPVMVKAPINEATAKPFERARIPIRSPLDLAFPHHNLPTCPACRKWHPRGACDLKAAGVEYCGLCGLAHFGHARTCPHIKSETQVREMLQALKNSPEKKELVEAAMKYLRGVKGTLVQQKKKDKEKALMQGGGSVPVFSGRSFDGRPYQGPAINGNGPFYPQGHSPMMGQGPSRRDVPPTYHASVNAVPSSVGSHITGQLPPQHQQRLAQGVNQQTNQPVIEDRDLENALRGFLGH